MLRRPELLDAQRIWRAIAAIGSLDRNSCYAYLVLCRDHADTCAVAERSGTLLGFVTGYVPPRRPDCLFVWQIGVVETARGLGLARRLLDHVLSREASRRVQFVEAHVTPSNVASRTLFQRLAEGLGAQLHESHGFERELFPEGSHEPERLLRIGPFRLGADVA